jgi:hypothetical protein
MPKWFEEEARLPEVLSNSSENKVTSEELVPGLSFFVNRMRADSL